MQPPYGMQCKASKVGCKAYCGPAWVSCYVQALSSRVTFLRLQMTAPIEIPYKRWLQNSLKCNIATIFFFRMFHSTSTISCTVRCCYAVTCHGCCVSVSTVHTGSDRIGSCLRADADDTGASSSDQQPIRSMYNTWVGACSLPAPG